MGGCDGNGWRCWVFRDITEGSAEDVDERDSSGAGRIRAPLRMAGDTLNLCFGLPNFWPTQISGMLGDV